MNSGKRRRKIKINSSMWKILKDIAKKNKRQLFLTFLLVAMENLMAILYPLFAGFAINAVVKGRCFTCAILCCCRFCYVDNRNAQKACGHSGFH